jgi:beta-galactosidase
MPWLTGAAYWPFKDFSTPLRPENPVPYVNQKGVTERDLKPKEAYYVFQSYWTEKPMLHIYGHSWPVRWGKPGEEKEILVYSNCPAVELFVNGESKGIKNRKSEDFPAAGLRWNCILADGTNQIKAVAVKTSVKTPDVIADEITVSYESREWGKPEKIQITPQQLDGDTVYVEAQLFDNKGVPCLDAQNVIYFDIAGDGKLIQNLGTSTGSRKVQAYNGRAAIRVKLSKECNMAVRSEGIETAFIHLKN